MREVIDVLQVGAGPCGQPSAPRYVSQQTCAIVVAAIGAVGVTIRLLQASALWSIDGRGTDQTLVRDAHA